METKQEKVGEEEFKVPIGYRFDPTDGELIQNYLTNKVFHRPLPAHFIPEIEAAELYSKPPMDLGSFGKRELYFYIHQDGYFRGVRVKIQIVGNGIGFWRSIGEEDPIYKLDGDVFAFKIYSTYYSGSPTNARKTQWKMERYRLPFKHDTDLLQREEWVLGRLRKGQDLNNFL